MKQICKSSLMISLAVTVTAAVPVLSCTKGGNQVAGLSGVTTGGSTSGTTMDVKKIVSVGAGLNFNASTGSWSEMANDPITNSPAIVYYDRTAAVSPVTGALKFAFMDGTGNWGIEIIDSNSPVTAITNTCGGGAVSANCIGAPNAVVPTASQPQIYDIDFLNTGGTTSNAVVAYAYGTGGAASSISGKSIRFAKRTGPGTWTIETAVTGAALTTLTTVGPQLATLEYAIKGIRMLIDDSNRVHLTFAIYSSTQVNSAFGYTMRAADGTWTTPTAIAASTPSTFTFVSGPPTYAAATGLVQTGAAWCKYTGGGTSADATGILLSMATTDNTPAASNQGFLLQCMTANANGSCANWLGLDFHDGCTGSTPCVTTTPALTGATSNAFGRSDIAVDPTTGKIFLSTSYAAPSLTAPMTAATGLLSTVSPTACSAGLSAAPWTTVIGHPTAAQGTLGLRVAADGTNFYLASLAGAAGTALNLNTQTSALSTNWIPAGQSQVDASANSIGGGFYYNSTTGVLWGSYGTLTAAAAGVAGQDIKAFGVYPADIGSTGPVLNFWHVDQTNTVAQSAAQPMLDSTVAPNGNLGYVYFYQEPGAAPGVNSHLYYGIRGGSSLSPLFGEKLVSNAIAGATTFMNGLHPSLAYDMSSNPVISFLSQGTAASSGFLMVARSNNGGVSFNLDMVDGSTVTTNNVGQHSSAHVSGNNTIGVSYYDFSTGATGQRLKFAKREKNGAWRRYIVDGPGSAGTNGCTTTTSATTGLHSNLEWTSTGRPVIVYQSSISGIKSLRLAFATEAETSATYTWTCLTLDSTGQGLNSRGEGIDFWLDSNDLPYISHYEATISALRVVTCGSAVLTCAATGSSAFTGERLPYLIGSILTGASKPGIRPDGTGKIWVSFHGPADAGVFIASKSAAGVWSPLAEAIETSPVNLGSTYTGQYASMSLNASLNPTVFYRSFENWIRYFSREAQ